MTTPRHRRTTRLLRGWLRAAIVFPFVFAACTYDRTMVPETPPEAPTARTLRYMPLTQRDAVFPPPEQFSARTWVDRLVCENGEQPGWRRTKRTGMVETYEVSCPGRAPFQQDLDTAGAEPAPGKGLRLVDLNGYGHFARSVALSQKKDFDGALDAIDRALKQQPDEPVFRLERISILYGQERWAEAFLETQALTQLAPTPMAWKFAALSAQKLMLHDLVKESVESFAKSVVPAHPLYGEATCAKGLYTLEFDRVGAMSLIKTACEAKYQPCCDAWSRRAK